VSKIGKILQLKVKSLKCPMELVHLNKIDFDAFICYVLKLKVYWGEGQEGRKTKWEGGWF
jgi:hypothetical protein